MAGYSTTPLYQKLGLSPDKKVFLIDAPANYNELIEGDISHLRVGENERPDFVHLFATKKVELEKNLQALLPRIKPTTVVWVSWYKKTAKMPTDITEDVIREIAVNSIFVDVKVCAVSSIWSGLKLVVRKENRRLLE
jgi:hypothetical protein